MNWLETIKTIAPVVASALGSPLAGVAVAAIGEMFGIEGATKEKIQEVIESGAMTADHIAALRTLEMTLKAEESERGFRYADLETKDRADARDMASKTGTKIPAILTLLIVTLVLGLEGNILVNGIPQDMNELVLGRILGTLDYALATAIAYWLGTTHYSGRKTELAAAASAK